MEPARNPKHTAMDVLDRVLQRGDEVDRILIITINPDGEQRSMYSNARSEPELYGMLWDGLHNVQQVE